MASTIAKTFFADASSVKQLKSAYFVMFLGVMAKPIGALLLGRIGDIYGRSKAINLGLVGTALGSLVIAATPSHAEIGVLSAFILLIARMSVAGMVSPGTDGVRIFIYEQIGSKHKCFGNGLSTMSTMLGTFLASFSAWIFSGQDMPEYSWRIAFVIGSISGIILVAARNVLNVTDSVKDNNDVEYEKYKDIPTLRIIHKNFKLFVICAILAGCIGGSSGQFSLIFFGTYMFQILDLIDEPSMKYYTTIAVVLYMMFALVAGLCADYFGKVRVAITAGILVLFTTILNACFIWNGDLKIELYFAMNILLPFMTMPALASVKGALPMVIRYRMFSLAHACGSICLSGTMAVFCTYLYEKTLLSFMPFVYFSFIILLMMLSIYLLNSKNFLSKVINAEF